MQYANIWYNSRVVVIHAYTRTNILLLYYLSLTLVILKYIILYNTNAYPLLNYYA